MLNRKRLSEVQVKEEIASFCEPPVLIVVCSFVAVMKSDLHDSERIPGINGVSVASAGGSEERGDGKDSDKTVGTTATKRLGSSRIQKFLRIVGGTLIHC